MFLDGKFPQKCSCSVCHGEKCMAFNTRGPTIWLEDGDTKNKNAFQQEDKIPFTQPVKKFDP